MSHLASVSKSNQNESRRIFFITQLMSIAKIYAISDLHVDQDENMIWVEQLSNDKYLNDTVIIAGWLIFM